MGYNPWGHKESVQFSAAFFIAQLSHSYMNNVNTITLTRWTFVGKVSL